MRINRLSLVLMLGMILCVPLTALAQARQNGGRMIGKKSISIRSTRAPCPHRLLSGKIFTIAMTAARKRSMLKMTRIFWPAPRHDR